MTLPAPSPPPCYNHTPASKKQKAKACREWQEHCRVKRFSPLCGPALDTCLSIVGGGDSASAAEKSGYAPKLSHPGLSQRPEDGRPPQRWWIKGRLPAEGGLRWGSIGRVKNNCGGWGAGPQSPTPSPSEGRPPPALHIFLPNLSHKFQKPVIFFFVCFFNKQNYITKVFSTIKTIKWFMQKVYYIHLCVSVWAFFSTTRSPQDHSF